MLNINSLISFNSRRFCDQDHEGNSIRYFG